MLTLWVQWCCHPVPQFDKTDIYSREISVYQVQIYFLPEIWQKQKQGSGDKGNVRRCTGRISVKKLDGNNILQLFNVYIYRTPSSQVCHLIVKKTLRGNVFFFFLSFFKQIKKQELRAKGISQSQLVEWTWVWSRPFLPLVLFSLQHWQLCHMFVSISICWADINN